MPLPGSGSNPEHSSHSEADVVPMPQRALRWLLSVPLYAKVSGIGLLITMLFGIASLYQTRIGMQQAHYTIRGESAWAAATSLAKRISPALVQKDTAAIDAMVDETRAMFPGLLYLFVLGPSGEVLSHGTTFPEAAPDDLAQILQGSCATCHSDGSPMPPPTPLRVIAAALPLSNGTARVFRQSEGMAIEVIVPLPAAPGGLIRMGVGDHVMEREMAVVSRSLLLTLAICAALGLVISLALAYVSVRPIHALADAADRIRRGDFGARAHVWATDEIGTLANAFNQMAEGLERYRAQVREKEEARQWLLGRIVQAQEDERKHIARELHDQLGQSLSHALLTIESACNDCPEHDVLCVQVRDDIRKLIDEVRLLAWNARPSILDDYGLDQALTRLVNETEKRTNIAFDYQYVASPGSGRLPDTIEVTLYRIAQEAMTNIVRHARATQVSVILMQYGHEASLIVEDDGIGMSGAETGESKRASLGLIGMNERAALVGGSCAIDSAVGKGTTVRVKIPLEQKGTHGNTNLHSG